MSRDFVSFNRRPSNRSTKEDNEIFSTLQNLGLVPDRQRKQQRRVRQDSSSRSVDFNTLPNTSRSRAQSPPSLKSGFHHRSFSFSRPNRTRPVSPPPPARPPHRFSPTYYIPTRAPLGSMRELNRVLDESPSHSRRDRTFVGSECAVCEEPLEHTLRGERILQLSCGHVAHEACFYEYIREFDAQQCPTCNAPLGLDTNRGGTVFDLEKLGSIIREAHEPQQQAISSPPQWEPQPAHIHEPPKGPVYQRPSYSSDHQPLGPRISTRVPPHHGRVDSTHGSEIDPLYPPPKPHDIDARSLESSMTSPRSFSKNPIPAPTVTVRSEFPTLNRSRQQQSLTCLVTVEVPDGKWRPDPDDIRSLQPMPHFHTPHLTEENYAQMSPVLSSRKFDPQSYEPPEMVDEITEDLHARVDNWHGLDFSKFGKLRLHGTVRVGKDRQQWQELECYLFSEMLICVKEKKVSPQTPQWGSVNSFVDDQKKAKCTLKGSILIKKHLKHVESSSNDNILTLSLSVAELPAFHLQFSNRNQLNLWKRALLDINAPEAPPPNKTAEYEQEYSGTDDDDLRGSRNKRVSSATSSYGASRSAHTAPTEYSNPRGPAHDLRYTYPLHVPVDLVIVIPLSSSMQGLKISLLRDTLRFLIQNLGERDRVGLVTFGSSGGASSLLGMTGRSWTGWSKVLDGIRPYGSKSHRADVVEGGNVAMDLLMQRKTTNPLSSILLISDSSTADTETVDFVVSRAEAAKVTIHSFGLGLTHKPDTMIELSTRTKASYTYVKDWMMLRECIAGCLGSLQTTSHQNVKLKLRLPEGSPAKFVKINGALQITKRATGRDAEAALGDLRFGDKRDILVQLAIAPDSSSPEQVPQDPWETIVSGLEALGGPLDQDDQRIMSVEEVPLIQADLTYGDILREGSYSHLPRPSLLAITMLPPSNKTKSNGRPITPPIPPHPSVVQRRMELLTSDMLTRALTLVSRGQHERGHHLLSETRSILKGLGKGGLPPIPQGQGSGRAGGTTVSSSASSNVTGNIPVSPGSALSEAATYSPSASTIANTNANGSSNNLNSSSTPTLTNSFERRRTPSPQSRGGSPFQPAPGIDPITMNALDAELESALEWIHHPAVFGRDSRKAVLQTIGVISSQRGYTFRTQAEALLASRVAGVKRMAERSREWRETGDESLMEEA